MAISYSQSWGGSGQSTDQFLAVSGATVGALLVCIRESRRPTQGAPAGWTIVQEYPGLGGGGQYAGMYYRIATGDSGDDVAQVTGAIDRWTIHVEEWLGSWDAAPLDDSATNSNEAVTGPLAVGTATPSTSDGLAIAGIGVFTNTDWGDTGWSAIFPTIDAGFIDFITEGPVATSRTRVGLWSQIYTTTSALSPTITPGGALSGEQATGFVALFKEGGASPTPPTDVDGGGPYSGTVGTPIAIDGASYTPGTGANESILWTNTGSGTWSDNSILSPTFTPDGVDTYTLTLTITNDAGSDADTASLTATAATLKEMYIKDGGTFKQATPYIKEGGVFVAADAYVRSGGAWVKVHDK